MDRSIERGPKESGTAGLTQPEGQRLDAFTPPRPISEILDAEAHSSIDVPPEYLQKAEEENGRALVPADDSSDDGDSASSSGALALLILGGLTVWGLFEAQRSSLKPRPTGEMQT